MRPIVITFIVFFLHISMIQAQTNDCLKDFNFLVDKIKADYPGYNDKVKPDNFGDLVILEKTLQNKINLYPDSCSFYLKQYAAYFKDNHLRVGKVRSEPVLEEKSEVSSFGKNIVPNLGELKDISANHKSIEGLWTSWRGDVAVVKNSESSSYLGIAINYQGWKVNQVVFEFEPRNDSVFNLKLHSVYEDHTPAIGIASLHLQNQILEIHDNTFFVRKTDSELMDKTLLYTYVPEFPNGRNTFFVATCLSDSTYYIRVPGFFGFRSKIEQTISKDWNDIMSRPNLIIDIRNNGGGQDDEYQSLLRLLYTNPYTTKGVEWYASPRNIKFFEDALEKGEIKNGDEGIRWTKELIGEMAKNKGGFVVHPSLKKSDHPTFVKDSIYRYPCRVGMIINEGNASSAEQFLLSAFE